MQIGFIVTQFSMLDDGRLILEEPDMASFPIKHIPTLNYTFKTLRSQKDVVESIDQNVSLNFSSILQAIAVHKNYKSSTLVMLERFDPEEPQSGWWINVPGDSSAEDYMLISLYQLALDRPDLVHFLALPVGFKVYDEKAGTFKLEQGGSEIKIRTGSYLYELLNKRQPNKKG